MASAVGRLLRAAPGCWADSRAPAGRDT